MLECKTLLIDATLKAMSGASENPGKVFPSRNDLLSSSKVAPLKWNHVLPRTPKQSAQSYREQLEVQSKTASHINKYLQPGTSAVKNLLIAGPPGVGKTHCMGHGIIYAICKVKALR